MKTSTFNILIAIVATVLFSSAALAGPGNGKGNNFDGRMGPPTAEEKLARLSEALDLSADQAVDMLEVLLAAEERRSATQEEIRALIEPQVCADRVQTEADMLAILTEEQALILEEMKAQREERANGRKGRKGPDFDCSAY